MFQCLGLGTAEEGGCGEDWWHPGCIVGMGPEWFEQMARTLKKPKNEGLLESITEVAEAAVEAPNGEEANGIDNPTETVPDEEEEDDDPPPPPGFPEEDDFDGFICYKCVDANPWIKRYADTKGFLGPVFKRSAAPSPEKGLLAKAEEAMSSNLLAVSSNLLNSKKRKADDDEESEASGPSKRVKGETPDPVAKTTSTETAETSEKPAIETPTCKYDVLPPPPTGQFSLFFKSDFRTHLCRCPSHFPHLKPHPQLLDEEEIYEPELSESGGDGDGASTAGSGSIYDRGESALKNVDRVKAIEGVMAYNHLKDKLTPFFKQFAESGKAISAEDIKAHFAKMRGDEEAIKAAGEGAKVGDNRREQSGF